MSSILSLRMLSTNQIVVLVRGDKRNSAEVSVANVERAELYVVGEGLYTVTAQDIAEDRASLFTLG